MYRVFICSSMSFGFLWAFGEHWFVASLQDVTCVVVVLMKFSIPWWLYNDRTQVAIKFDVHPTIWCRSQSGRTQQLSVLYTSNVEFSQMQWCNSLRRISSYRFCYFSGVKNGFVSCWSPVNSPFEALMLHWSEIISSVRETNISTDTLGG